MSRFVRYPKPGANSTIRRFEPAYWTVDFPIAMMATLVTTGANAMRMKALFRTNRDLMGLIWEIEDRDDHGAYAYPRRKDYRGCVLEFDWASSGIRQMHRLQSVTLTVETFTGVTHFVRIWNYKTSGTPDACHIRMVFDDTTKSGFYADTIVPWNSVKRMFISLQPITAGRGNCSLAAEAAPAATSLSINVGDAGPVTPGAKVYILGSSYDVPAYTVTSTTTGAVQTIGINPPLSTTGGFSIAAGAEVFIQTATDEQIGETAAQVDMTNISVTGTNSTLPMLTTPQAAHTLRMADGYDNAYPFTPERLAEQVYNLGYRDFYVLYMGISKFHSLSWDAGESRYIVDPAKPKLNDPTQQWLDDFFARLHAKGFKIILSVSFEILAMFMPTVWKQRDHAGNEAQTGWTPPSSLIAPTVQAGKDYLRDVFLATLARLPGAAEKHFQIGEPWWWDGSYGSNAPHIYDATTQAAYITATGQAVPTPKLTTIFGHPAAQHIPYLQWCRDQLGVATAWLVSQVKATHPTAKTYLLIFTPQILRGDAPMVRTLNFPEAAWQSPAFDVLQIEDYDKVIEGDYAFTDQTWLLATTVLGYTKAQIHYFAGFNLLPQTTWIWFNTDKAIWRAYSEAPAGIFVWSREQVMRDGWLFDQQSWKVYPPLTRLASCWRLERTDGVIEGYTSFDKPLVIDGVTYIPANSFSASQLASDTEMSVADVEIVGGIDSDNISAADILAGIYDHAAVELFVVDWGDLTIPKTIVRRGWIGTLSQAGNQFRAELRGLGQRIQIPVIDSYSAECRVDLYSAKCGVTRASFGVVATVTTLTDGSLGAAADNRIFFASALGQPEDWFSYGELWWATGANAGRKVELRSYSVAGRVELWEPMGLNIAVGDTFTIYAGCDKAFGTCTAKFANAVNFRGEPHVPGMDAMLRYPDPHA
jgi:uncharacterized phage protein (TIGR02218 family)